MDPNYEGSYCNRIITYTEMGQHEQAELMFYLARQVKEQCPACCYNIGNSFFARGLYEKAIGCWRQARALRRSTRTPTPASPSALRQGRMELARTHYLAELRIDPGNIETLLDLGELLTEMDQFQEAGEKFRRVLEQSPEHAGPHFCLGHLALKQDKLITAEDQFRLVLRLEANYPGAHLKPGRSCCGPARRNTPSSTCWRN